MNMSIYMLAATYRKSWYLGPKNLGGRVDLVNIDQDTRSNLVAIVCLGIVVQACSVLVKHYCSYNSSLGERT